MNHKINVYCNDCVQVQLLARDMKNQRVLANRTIDFCDIDDYINGNVFFKSFLSHLLDNLQFELKCPFKKVKTQIDLSINSINLNPNPPFFIDIQGIYVIKEHHMPNYVIIGMMQAKDKFANVQKVKTRIDKHIKTIFESSYNTEVCEFD